MRDDEFPELARRLWLPLRLLLASPPFPAERAGDEPAVRDVLNVYTYSYDSGDLPGVLSVFADDAVLVNPRGTFEGREAIERNFAWLIANRRSGLHVVGNVVARPGESADSAWLGAYYNATATMVDGSLKLGSGTYFHRLTRSSGVWRIQEGRITDSTAGALSPASGKGVGEPPEPTSRESSDGLEP